MRNKLTDLNNHLFEQLERLNDNELSIEDMNNELKRSKAMCDISRNIIDNARTQIEGAKLQEKLGITPSEIPVLNSGN